MLAVEQIETVLISTEPTPNGHERIVVAFGDQEDLYIPLDESRPANAELLSCDRLFVREASSQDDYEIYVVVDSYLMDDADRERLEAYVCQPISTETRVLRASRTPAHLGDAFLDPPGFVVVVDGSERAGRAIRPAMEIADWYGRSLVVCAVTAGVDDLDTRSAVELQLQETGIDERDIRSVPVSDLDRSFNAWTTQGQIVVGSAFGVWAGDGRLHGVVNGLVQHNAPVTVGIGPQVPPDWAPTTTHPLVVFVDTSDHAHDVVERMEPLLEPSRSPVMVVHVTTDQTQATSIARKVATAIHRRYGMPVQAKNVHGHTIAEAIGTTASAVDAQMIVLTSWHRPTGASQQTASTSVSAVAHAPCPVVILSAGGPAIE